MHTPDHRQVLMEEWYRELIASGRAEEESVEAYAPHADFLRSLSGRVLDVGGGCGLAARHLAREVDYFVVEPSTLWTSPEWSNLSRWFCRNGPTPKIISAYGGQLPFGDREFDAVLSLWALNHVDDPRACVAEMIRVLKPGGVARLVLEDMQPTWSDFIRDGFRRGLAWLTGSMWPAEIQLPN